MKRFFLTSVFVFTALVARAEVYKIDPSHSFIRFSVRHLLGTARGEFHKFTGTIEFDPKQPEQSSVNVSIQIASIDTKIKKRDQHLLGADFFDAAKFPEITFRSSSVKSTGAESGEIRGQLNMHGVVREMILRVKLLNSSGAQTRWSVTADPIHRKDFGLMFSGTAETISGIGQDVVPSIEIEAVRAN